MGGHVTTARASASARGCTMTEKKTITVGSLFAGIGGLDLGLERAGMECKWQVEIDEYARRVLAKHWPNVRRWDDIKTFPPDSGKLRRDAGRAEQPLQGNRESCQASAWDVDAICGGFPCQDISYAGRGAGLDGERSGLFFEALRVVRRLRPRYVLLENVAALLTRGLDRVHGELAEIGYSSESHCIPAASVGAPHIRDRVFILAYADRPGRDQQRRPVAALAKQQAPKRCGSELAYTTNAVRWPDGGDPEQGGAEHGQQPRRAISGAPTISDWWAVEPDVGRVANGIPKRVDRLRGLGNAVVPQIAEYIGRCIIDMDAQTTNARGGE